MYQVCQYLKALLRHNLYLFGGFAADFNELEQTVHSNNQKTWSEKHL